MKLLTYGEILEANTKLSAKLTGKPYDIAVISNLVTASLNEILEYSLKIETINARVKSGEYDNIVQDSLRLANHDAIIIFWEFANLLPGFHYRIHLMSQAELETVIDKVKSEIDLVLMQLAKVPLVIFNRFSSTMFPDSDATVSASDTVCKTLNAHLESQVMRNVLLMDIEKIINAVSLEKSVDLRYFYSSSALWSVDFFKAYAEALKPDVLRIQGKSKKVLVLDLDNTLWSGILGEDGSANVEMTQASKKGALFEEIQCLLKKAAADGALLCISSKNNPADVKEMFTSRSDMILKESDFIVQKIDWRNKVDHLLEISKELNIGLDAFVFVDDSDFELNLIKEQLPEVDILKVPAKLHEYPALLRNKLRLFKGAVITREDSKKTEMYRQESIRAKEKMSFQSIDNYLTSLGLEMTLYRDFQVHNVRISQLTQKTNQFNLTTHRYTPTEIDRFTNENTHRVYSFELKDRLGDYGITGACIIHMDLRLKEAMIDTYLLSCRVLGRGVEFTFLSEIIEQLKNLGLKTLKAVYFPTAKNDQVSDYYDKMNFRLEKVEAHVKYYTVNIDEFIPHKRPYIKTHHGK